MIYFFNDYDNFSAEKILKFLPKNRQEKFNRLKRKNDRDNCAVAYLLLRFALKENGIEDFEIVGYDPYPTIKGKVSV